MEVLGGLVLVIMICCGAFVFLLGISSLLLWMTAGMVSIENNSLGKAFLSTLCGFFASLAVGGILGLIPFLGILLSLITTLIIPSVITMAIFSTTFTKAFLAELFRFLIMTGFSILMGILAVMVLGMETIQGHASQYLEQFTSSIYYLF